MDFEINNGIYGREVQGSSDIMITEGGFEPLKEVPKNQIKGYNKTTNFKQKEYSQSTKGKKKRKGAISTFFSDLSRWGMNYDDDVIANMRAIPADKSLVPKPDAFIQQDLFQQLNSSWKQKQNKDKDFYEKDFTQKREALRKLAVQPELEDILDTMCNECVVYDSNYRYFAEPYIDAGDLQLIKKEFRKKITDNMAKDYTILYKMLSWQTKAWDDFKRYLVEGIMSWEIVYDSLEKPTKIIGLVPLDPATLTKKFENNKFYWIQYKGVMGRERKLLDAQVIYIQYQETDIISRVSYLERLIRPYNIYRIIEQAQIIWTVTNAQYKMKFTIPIKGMNKTNGMQTLASAMNRYKEDIKFVSDSGELTINGQVNMPFQKEYWMPEGDAGSPQIETIGSDGPDLNDDVQLRYFKNQLYKISKIPISRFDQDGQESWPGADATSYMRDEINFARFVQHMRQIFAQIILKPLRIQMILDMPELADDRLVLDSIQLHYKSYNLFEELMEIDVMQKRVEFIQTMKDSMVDMDVEGNEIKFFSSKFLVDKYLKLSKEDLKLNDKMKQDEIEELHLAGGENSDQAAGLDMSSLDDEIKNILNEAKKEIKKKIRNRQQKGDEEEE